MEFEELTGTPGFLTNFNLVITTLEVIRILDLGVLIRHNIRARIVMAFFLVVRKRHDHRASIYILHNLNFMPASKTANSPIVHDH